MLAGGVDAGVQSEDGFLARVYFGDGGVVEHDDCFMDEDNNHGFGLDGVLGWGNNGEDTDCTRRYGELCLCPGELGCGRNTGARLCPVQAIIYLTGGKVWRCWVLYKGSSKLVVWASLVIPVCFYLAVIGASSWQLCDWGGQLRTRPGMGLAFMVPDRPTAKTRIYELVYSCLTLALNVVVTCMISLRLLFCRSKVKTGLGETHSVQYNSIIAMLIESAALVVIFNAFFVATIRTQSLFHYIAFAGNAQAQVSQRSPESQSVLTFRVLR